MGAVVLSKGNRALSTDPGTGMAAPALVLVHRGLAGVVLFHLAGAASAAHAQVFQRAAEPGALVPLEMNQVDHHVRVHHRPADLGGLAVDAAHHRHLHLVGAFQAVRNDHRASGGQRAEPVFPGGFNVLHRVFAAAHIQGVAVGQERDTALGLDHLHHRARPVGPQVGQVARLTKIDLDGHKLLFQIQLGEPGCVQQAAQFVLQAGARHRPQIGKPYLCFFHRSYPPCTIRRARLLPNPARQGFTLPAAPVRPGRCGTSQKP